MGAMTDTVVPLDVGPDRPECFHLRPNAAAVAQSRGVPVLDIVVPVYNEQVDLANSVRRLHHHLRRAFSVRGPGSPSPTTPAPTPPRRSRRGWPTSCPTCVWCGWSEKGRGRALHAVWSASDAPVLAYMDVDLSTDLAALPPLVAPLISGHSDLAIGTRLARGSRVVRGAKREVISRCYNLLLQITLAARLLRRAMRVQGDPRRRRRTSCFPTSRTPDGFSTPSCWSSPSVAACASTRCRWTGSTTPTAASTSSRPLQPTSGAWRG